MKEPLGRHNPHEDALRLRTLNLPGGPADEAMAALYLKLDASNDPVTGPLDVQNNDQHALRVADVIGQFGLGGILDDFNRADGDPGENWASSGMVIHDHRLTPTPDDEGNVAGSASWLVPPGSADQEAYITLWADPWFNMSHSSDFTAILDLFVRRNDGPPASDYHLHCYIHIPAHNSSPWIVQMSLYQSGVAISLPITALFHSGDTFGICVIGNGIIGYYKSYGSTDWTYSLHAFDDVVSAAGTFRVSLIGGNGYPSPGYSRWSLSGFGGGSRSGGGTGYGLGDDGDDLLGDGLVNGRGAFNVNTLTGQTSVVQLIAAIADGTPPLIVDSKTLVTNLNADQLDGHHASDFATAGSGITGSGTSGRMAQWTGAAALGDSSLIKSGAGVLTISSAADYTLTAPKTGTLVVGTGTAGRIAEWVTDANTVQASTLAKTGAGILTLKTAAVDGELYINAATGYTHFQLSHLIAAGAIQLAETDSHSFLIFEENKTFTAMGGGTLFMGGYNLTVPATGTAVLTTRTLSTTAPLSGGGDLSANRTLSMAQAAHGIDGYLSGADWDTFNGKQPLLPVASSSSYLRDNGAGVKTWESIISPGNGGTGVASSYNLTIGATSSISGTAIVGTPGTLTVSTTNAATDPHTHAITSSSAPGAAASLLATSATGSLKINLLGVRDGDITDGYASCVRITGHAGDTLPCVVISPVSGKKAIQLLGAGGGTTADFRNDTGSALTTYTSSGNAFTFNTTTGTVMGGATTTGMMFSLTMAEGVYNANGNSFALYEVRTTGTAVAPFGAYERWMLQSSTTVRQEAVRWYWEWADATHASRRARARWTVWDTAEREGFRIEASGAAPAIGFLGAAAVVQQTGAAIPTDLASCITAITALRAALNAYGLTTVV